MQAAHASEQQEVAELKQQLHDEEEMRQKLQADMRLMKVRLVISLCTLYNNLIAFALQTHNDSTFARLQHSHSEMLAKLKESHDAQLRRIQSEHQQELHDEKEATRCGWICEQSNARNCDLFQHWTLYKERTLRSSNVCSRSFHAIMTMRTWRD